MCVVFPLGFVSPTVDQIMFVLFVLGVEILLNVYSLVYLLVCLVWDLQAIKQWQYYWYPDFLGKFDSFQDLHFILILKWKMTRFCHSFWFIFLEFEITASL